MVYPYFPELLARILPANSLQDLGAAGMLVDEVRYIIYRAVDDYELAITGGGGVFCHVCGCECFRHFVRNIRLVLSSRRSEASAKVKSVLLSMRRCWWFVRRCYGDLSSDQGRQGPGELRGDVSQERSNICTALPDTDGTLYVLL